MRRIINQLNVSITTNRTCNLRCKHCYILPHVFKDKTTISKEDYKLVFDRVEELYAIDQNLKEIEWEVIGGETTMMPFEFWEEMLPWSLKRVNEINATLKNPGSLNFLTNLIFIDNRYIELINAHGADPAFSLYTSWEPDTNRFGTNNKLYSRFKKTLKSIKADRIMLDIILTKGVIEIGAKAILDEFVPLGVTDFSCKMLSPYGQGRQFFDSNMTDFLSMSNFLIDMKKYKPSHVTFTPDEEMSGALNVGNSFQCNGNFYYDLAIEPDGTTTFNANQTAEEAAVGFNKIHIHDQNWARKVILENTPEANKKLTLMHDECHQCEYMRFCNAGWYHYKTMQRDKLAQFSKDDCPGLKKYWNQKKSEQDWSFKASTLNHITAVKKMLAINAERSNSDNRIKESSVIGYENFASMQFDGTIVIDKSQRFGKSLSERLWFYDALRIRAEVDCSVFMEAPDAEAVIMHSVYGNYAQSYISKEIIWKYVESHENSTICKLIKDAQTAINSILHGMPHSEHNTTFESGLSVSDVNDELFRWVIRNPGALDHQKISLSEQQFSHLSRIVYLTEKEAGGGQ